MTPAGPAPRRPAGLAAAAAVSVLGLALAGCTASSQGTARTSRPTTASPTTPSAVSSAASSAVVDPAVSSSPAPPSSTAAPAAPTRTGTPQPAPRSQVAALPRSTCTKVSVRVIRGSAARGIEFAALQFTNDGTSRCRLSGYPGATLRLHGETLGRPAQPATTAASHIVLAAGATAESRLTDYTNCQAPLSDQVRVDVPGSDIHAVRPAQLRGCTLRVGKLGTPE